MFSTLITVTLFVSFAIQGTFAGFAVNTPKLNECTSSKVSWSHGIPPYSVEVVSAQNPCGAVALLAFTNIQETVFDLDLQNELKAGTKVMIFVTDSSDNEAWSGTITIGGSSEACTSSSSSTASTTSTTSPSNADNKAIPQVVPTSSGSPVPSGLGGAINAGSSSSGILTVHRASTPLLFTALAALLALTLY